MAKTNNKGFTLIEIVIAVAILSILLTPILKQFANTLETSRKAKALQQANETAVYEMEEFQTVTKEELELLVNGGSVQKNINQELTYKELYSSMDNLWSTLFMTGYLTQRGEPVGNRYDLAIPNQEIRNIITEHILQMFQKNVKNDGTMADSFCSALEAGNASPRHQSPSFQDIRRERD